MKYDFQIDHVICSVLQEREQRLTGRIAGLHPYGEAKSDLVVRLAEEHCIDLSQSYCYADHHTDEGMLRRFGHPVCVNPTARLRASAHQAGWRVEVFE
jgi:phosphoserine phosphatase